MYDDIRDAIVALVDMQRDDKYSEMEILEHRVLILQAIVFTLLTRERASLSNSQRTLSNYDRDLAKLVDAMKSVMRLTTDEGTGEASAST